MPVTTAAVGPEARAGLASATARALLRKHGPNTLRRSAERPLAVEILRRFRSPLIVVLLAASAGSAFMGDLASFAIIVTMVVLSVAIDFVQEHRAGEAAKALLRRVQVKATALRDGVPTPVAVAHLVPGDVVLLGPGSIIPADGQLLEASALHADESALTGEPFPVEKRAQADAGAEDGLFMGTSIVSGTGSMLVTVTGAATRFGKIAGSLAAEPPPTSFERGTRAFGMLIMRLTAFMVMFVVVLNAVAGRPLLESLLFAIALAVGLTPELLPMIVTVTLARGALRMAGEHVIVKRLTAIEGLGSMDVLCTDKTGTLTRAKIRLERHAAFDGSPAPRAAELAALNAKWSGGIHNPVDEALAAHAPAGSWSRVGETPFDFERRRVAVLLDDGSERILVVKGAADGLVSRCARYEAASGEALKWNEEARAACAQTLERLEGEGLRVLAVASRKVARDEPDPLAEEGLALAGFVGLADPPKPGAMDALAALAASGVEVKILTGDSDRVACHLCERMGLGVTGILTGAEIARLDDPALAARVDQANLFCRVDPAQKNRIVQMLRRRGHVVGFLGDGINDAPALHSADVGLSVHNAVDVAREAADMILMRHDLGVLHRGVLEGRRTFANIRKYILMASSSNFGNMFSMAAAAAFLPFLPMRPAQILLNNLLYDVSEVPIPLDEADAADLARPQRWDMSLIRGFMWTLGPVSSLFDFLTFYVLLAVLGAGERLFQTGWFVESLATQVLVIFVIRTRGNPFASRPSRTLLATSLAVVAGAILLPFTPLAGPLGFEPPPASFFAALAAMVVAYLFLAEAVKRAFYRRLARPALSPAAGSA